MKVREMLTVAKYLLLSKFDKSTLARRLEQEREIMNVVTVLPQKYSYKQVERALKAANATPKMIHVCLATGEKWDVLEQFYAALNVQGEREQGDMSDDWREEEWW
jgi:hypothetical protein